MEIRDPGLEDKMEVKLWKCKWKHTHPAELGSCFEICLKQRNLQE